MPAYYREERKEVTEIVEIKFTEEEVKEALIHYYNLIGKLEALMMADEVVINILEEGTDYFPVMLTGYRTYQEGEY